MSTEIDELKQARYRSDKTISGHNAFLRPPTGETNSVDTRGFYFVLKEPHPFEFWVQRVTGTPIEGKRGAENQVSTRRARLLRQIKRSSLAFRSIAGSAGQRIVGQS